MRKKVKTKPLFRGKEGKSWFALGVIGVIPFGRKRQNSSTWGGRMKDRGYMAYGKHRVGMRRRNLAPKTLFQRKVYEPYGKKKKPKEPS